MYVSLYLSYDYECVGVNDLSPPDTLRPGSLPLKCLGKFKKNINTFMGGEMSTVKLIAVILQRSKVFSEEKSGSRACYIIVYLYVQSLCNHFIQEYTM